MAQRTLHIASLEMHQRNSFTLSCVQVKYYSPRKEAKRCCASCFPPRHLMSLGELPVRQLGYDIRFELHSDPEDPGISDGGAGEVAML